MTAALNITDRELLELAAKAAGIGPVIGFDGALVIGPNSRARHWHPLGDDGDALRLAVTLSISIELRGLGCRAFQLHGCLEVTEPYHGNEYGRNTASGAAKAVRHAIVRLAAEIGRAMP